MLQVFGNCSGKIANADYIDDIETSKRWLGTIQHPEYVPA